MSPRTPLAVATCLLLGLALYVGYLGSGTGEPGETPTEAGEPKEPSEPREPREPREAAMRGKVDLDKPQFDVVLRIDPVGRILPPPRRRPTLRLWRGTTLVPAEVSWVAGRAGLPLARTFGGRQLVRFQLPGGRNIYRVVHLGGRSQDIDVRWLGSSDYQGRVVDREQQPIVGASVWLAGERAQTDEDGIFHIPDLPRGRGLPLVIRASGHAGLFRVLDVPRHRDGLNAKRNTFALAPGVDLKVRFVATVRDATKGSVFVQPESEQRDTRLLHHPFLMQAVEGGVRLDKDGMATVPGLPQGAMVRVSVWHPDTLVQQRPIVSLGRRKQPQPQVAIHAGKAQCLVGKVRTDSAQPVPGAWLVSRRSGSGPGFRTLGLLPPFLYLDGSAVSYAITSADGSYRLPLVAPARVTVAAPERLGLALKVALAEERDLVLPRPVDVDKPEPRLRLRFKNASGRVFRLHVLEGGRPRQQPFLLRDTDDHAEPLSTRMLADIQVEARAADGSVRKWSFPNRLVQDLVDLSLDY